MDSTSGLYHMEVVLFNRVPEIYIVETLVSIHFTQSTVIRYRYVRYKTLSTRWGQYLAWKAPVFLVHLRLAQRRDLLGSILELAVANLGTAERLAALDDAGIAGQVRLGNAVEGAVA